MPSGIRPRGSGPHRWWQRGRSTGSRPARARPCCCASGRAGPAGAGTIRAGRRPRSPAAWRPPSRRSGAPWRPGRSCGASRPAAGRARPGRPRGRCRRCRGWPGCWPRRRRSRSGAAPARPGTYRPCRRPHRRSPRRRGRQRPARGPSIARASSGLVANSTSSGTAASRQRSRSAIYDFGRYSSAVDQGACPSRCGVGSEHARPGSSRPGLPCRSTAAAPRPVAVPFFTSPVSSTYAELGITGSMPILELCRGACSVTRTPLAWPSGSCLPGRWVGIVP